MKTGIKGQAEITVTADLLASHIGSGAVSVYATPMMIAGIENTAAASVAPELAEGDVTVGVDVNVAHVSATPLGMKVRFQTELTEISSSGKVLTFAVEAYDEAGLIGKGTHRRAIVNRAKFESRTNSKQPA